AVLMPLEQAHCAWMALQEHSPSGKTAVHACCAKSAPRPQGATCPMGCACIELPSAVPIAATSVQSTAASVAVLPLSAISVATPSTQTSSAPAALDTGSPPLLIDLGAHGLRAPPLSA